MYDSIYRGLVAADRPCLHNSRKSGFYYLIINEILGAQELVGMGLMIVGMLLAQIQSLRAETVG